MINVKTFLSLKNIASTDELDFGEIGILNEQLYFRGFDDRIYKIRYNEDDTYYTDIYGIRLPITYPQNPAQLTDDKMERVLIKRLVDEDGNYIDTEFDGDDTEMKYVISWDEGRVVEDTISQNYHPFNKMEVIDARYIGSEATILPIFYKNKTLAKTVNGKDYIYYLISERPFDDFYPVESHLNQDGYYSKEIYLESDWREVPFSNPLELEGYEDKRLYENDFYMNASIWSDYLYYLYMIKTMSFFPFKQLVENYTPVYYTTSYAPLNSITQTPEFTVDGTLFTITRIKLNNASDLKLTDGICVLAGIAFNTGDNAPNIRNLPLSQTYPNYPVFTRAFVHRIPDTDDYEIVPDVIPFGITFAQNTAKPYIVFLSQIPYDYYPNGELVDDVHEYEDLDIENGTLESPVRMKVDFIKNIFPVFYNATCVLDYNRSSITLEQQLMKHYNYNTPIFFSTSSNILYEKTLAFKDNIIESRYAGGSNIYIKNYFVNNLMLDYEEFNLLVNTLQKSNNYLQKLNNKSMCIGIQKTNTISNASELENKKIIGNIEGIKYERTGTLSTCFIGSDENLFGTYDTMYHRFSSNDDPASGKQGFCWNSFLAVSSSLISLGQFDYGRIVSRRVAYSKEQ